jgi:hypothetical protein
MDLVYLGDFLSPNNMKNIKGCLVALVRLVDTPFVGTPHD